MHAIQTFDLTKRYGTRAAKSVLAVDRISFVVEEGQVFGFLGPNGSGKTTTIGMLVGTIKPTDGSFNLFGASGPKRLMAARARVGATLETPNFYPYMSGRDNLRVAAAVKGVGRPRIGECLELVGGTFVRRRADDPALRARVHWRTAHQNAIDGLSKERFFAGRVVVLAGLVLLFMATTVLTRRRGHDAQPRRGRPRFPPVERSELHDRSCLGPARLRERRDDALSTPPLLGIRTGLFCSCNSSWKRPSRG
ncbi:MAG: ATP-binding cassette domain-containing protein [Gammaproteobacteria bacterium]|nr:ATP-binding cassette domain-containing protein [Gammaproteobacteria bacterium]